MYVTMLFVLTCTFADFLTEKILWGLHVTFSPVFWFREVKWERKTLLVEDLLLNTKIYEKLMIFKIKYYWYIQVVYWRTWYHGVVKCGWCITNTCNNDIFMYLGYCLVLFSNSVYNILLQINFDLYYETIIMEKSLMENVSMYSWLHLIIYFIYRGSKLVIDLNWHKKAINIKDFILINWTTCTK